MHFPLTVIAVFDREIAHHLDSASSRVASLESQAAQLGDIKQRLACVHAICMKTTEECSQPDKNQQRAEM